MDKKIKYLILPDVHGRDFWREPVAEVLADSDAHIIFLGDYLDPYPHEWDDDIDYKNNAVKTFEEIIELKKANPDRITLLLGNHDATYAISDRICWCRVDEGNFGKISKMFLDNAKLFQLAEEVDVADKHFVFSHAGILKEWAKVVWKEDAQKDGFKVVDMLNNAWFTDEETTLAALGIYDRYRGWGGSRFGSPLWSDIRSWLNIKPEDTYGFNIVGHTQLDNKTIMFDTIIDLDVRRAFYLDDEGNIRDYATDEIQEKTKRGDE